MDLGCIDMGCIEKQSKETSPDRENSPSDSVMSTSKGSKSNVGVLNKFTSQIKKPPHRKSSPLNWFPRKKVDSYLKRKIKLLQEVDGMNSTLDETLGDSNPHYSKVLREKIAVREAADKAMEARKAALVEASWCRILKAARIESKEAEAQLLKAEECAAKAFEAATAIGVIMHDIPDCPSKQYKIETSSPKGGSTTHTIKTSFETAFEVDKQVAAAVKSAFLKLANCPSINKDDFKELLRKISEHPDENYHEMSEFSSEYDSDIGAEPELQSQKCTSQDLQYEKAYAGVRQKNYKMRQVFEKFKMTNLVEMMLERLKGLQEDELASLATIVATCGLNAALAGTEKNNELDLCSAADNSSTLDGPPRKSCFPAGKTRKMADTELPSLDKFLVKRLTRLEKEALEAKNARNSERAREVKEQKYDKSQDESFFPNKISSSVCNNSDLGDVLQKPCSRFEKEIEATKKNSAMNFNFESKKLVSGMTSDVVPDLGSVLIKHTSKLEKEVAEARRKDDRFHETNGMKLDKKTVRRAKQDDEVMVPSLDKFLVKRVSRLEKEVQEAKDRRFLSSADGGALGKENIDHNKNEIEAVSLLPQDGSSCTSEPLIGEPFEEAEAFSLNDKIEAKGNGESNLDKKPTLKPSLRKDKMQDSSFRTDHAQKHHRKHVENCCADSESLDKILVKHVSRLEKEKLEIHAKDEAAVTKGKRREDVRKELEMNEGSLDQVLVKCVSRLEQEKMSAAQQPDNQIRHSTARREARERELQQAWGGLSLDMKQNNLDQVFVKHRSRLEREKMSAAEQPDNQIRHSTARREAREKELQEAWGGLGLGNSMRPHLSRLERDKAAWLKAEEEERQKTMKE